MKSGKTNLAYANLMLEWAKDLFPICRSITGAGIKKTISYLQNINNEVKTLRFKSFLGSDPIDEFVDSYNYSERVQYYISGSDSDYEGNLPKVDINKIDMSYSLGIDNLILDFGIIVAMNYLLKKGKPLNIATKLK